MANNSIGMKLPSIDELFSTQEERDINGRTKGRIVAVPLGQIDPFPDHPFSVRMDEDMEQLVESIKERGQITPAMVRQKPNGRYEMICGHRRAKACELAGLPTLLAEVKEMDRDEAIVYMVDSNLQRTHILPSEKAKAYQMKLDAMKRKSGRPSQKNYSPVGNNFSEATSSDEMAKEIGDSKTQIFRYVRLNNLTKPLLEPSSFPTCRKNSKSSFAIPSQRRRPRRHSHRRKKCGDFPRTTNWMKTSFCPS